MRTTIDIPDSLYRQLKLRALEDGQSVKQLVLQGVEVVLRQNTVARAPDKRILPRLSKPFFRSGEPGSLRLTNEMIDDLLYNS